MAHRADHVIVCSHYMRGHVADVFGLDEERVERHPQRDRPDRPAARRRPRRAARAVRRARREARPARRPARLREGLPARARRAAAASSRASASVRFLVAGSGTHEAELQEAGRARSGSTSTARSWAGSATTSCTRSTGSPTSAWSRRIYEPFGLVALEAMASGCPCIVADTGGLREVVPNERRRPALPRRATPRALGAHGRAGAHRRGAARPAGHRGLRARAALRLGRHRPPDAAVYDELQRPLDEAAQGEHDDLRRPREADRAVARADAVVTYRWRPSSTTWPRA